MSRVNRTGTGYTVEDTAAVRFNAMGMIQNIDLATRSELNMDFSLDAFDFSIRSGQFDFKASGVVNASVLTVTTTGAGKTTTIRLVKKLFRDLADKGKKPCSCPPIPWKSLKASVTGWPLFTKAVS